MIVRHAEKPPDDGGAPRGVQSDGSHDPHSLTVGGWMRASALVNYFASPIVPGIERPASIFAANALLSHGPHSKRPAQTVGPLAARLGIDPNLTHSVGDEAALAADVLSAPGPVLIAWEHVAITSIVQNLGLPAFTTVWDKHRFDLVWCLRWNGTAYDFSVIEQQLLDNDAGT